MKDQFNIDALLEPYTQGGIPSSPVKLTLTLIASKLIISYKLPADVVGAAIYKVFEKMAYHGLEFKGDGTYGSKGAELFSCMKAQAIDMVKTESTKEVIDAIKDMTMCTVENCPMRSRLLKKKTRLNRLTYFLLKPRGLWRL